MVQTHTRRMTKREGQNSEESVRRATGQKQEPKKKLGSKKINRDSGTEYIAGTNVRCFAMPARRHCGHFP